MVIGVGVLAGLAGCARLAEEPEVNPDRWAPPSADRIWTPSPASASDYRIPSELRLPPGAATPGTDAAIGAGPVLKQGQPYDLPALLDLALRVNPDTRFAWESARQAAASFGAARAPYYPLVSANSANGYTRTLFPLPGGQLPQFKYWQAEPLVQMTYTLLDFGRRSSSAEAARQALAAANFSFDRRIQDVVFGVQRAYYALCAAKAAVTAARQNLELAQSDFDAVQQRLNLGLATQPALLLARERVAQSQYDVANAELMVHDAQAGLAAAIGISADEPMEVASLETVAVPAALDGQVDELIAATIRQRPDLAAKVAGLRASQARVALAKAAWYPTVGLTANYGQLIWQYTFLGPPNTWANQPQYSALLTLRWDLFTGFLMVLQRPPPAGGEDDRDVRALTSGLREINTIAEMWRAYFEVGSSLRPKYTFAQSSRDSASEESYNANLEERTVRGSAPSSSC